MQREVTLSREGRIHLNYSEDIYLRFLIQNVNRIILMAYIYLWQLQNYLLAKEIASIKLNDLIHFITTKGNIYHQILQSIMYLIEVFICMYITQFIHTASYIFLFIQYCKNNSMNISVHFPYPFPLLYIVVVMFYFISIFSLATPHCIWQPVMATQK